MNTVLDYIKTLDDFDWVVTEIKHFVNGGWISKTYNIHKITSTASHLYVVNQYSVDGNSSEYKMSYSCTHAGEENTRPTPEFDTAVEFDTEEDALAYVIEEILVSTVKPIKNVWIPPKISGSRTKH